MVDTYDRAPSKGLYKQLPLLRNEIRLLTLLPGRRDEPVICGLNVVDASASPSYEAVSYVWGSERSKEPITVNGVDATIHENLHCALKAFRSETEERNLWVDAICINQQDLEEKAEQVQVMGSIYEHAESVLAWLGPETSDWEYEVLASGYNSLAEYSEDLFLWSPKQDSTGKTRLLMEHWPSFSKMLSRSYWTRTWIIQEYIIAQRCWLYWHEGCKMTRHDLEIVYSANQTLMDVLSNKDRRGYGVPEAWPQALEPANVPYSTMANVGRLAFNSKCGMLDMISQLSETKCSNYRDRIYSILSLSGVESASETISVSYDVELVDLFVQVLHFDVVNLGAQDFADLRHGILQLKTMFELSWTDIEERVFAACPELWRERVTIHVPFGRQIRSLETVEDAAGHSFLLLHAPPYSIPGVYTPAAGADWCVIAAPSVDFAIDDEVHLVQLGRRSSNLNLMVRMREDGTGLKVLCTSWYHDTNRKDSATLEEVQRLEDLLDYYSFGSGGVNVVDMSDHDDPPGPYLVKMRVYDLYILLRGEEYHESRRVNIPAFGEPDTLSSTGRARLFATKGNSSRLLVHGDDNASNSGSEELTTAHKDALQQVPAD